MKTDGGLMHHFSSYAVAGLPEPEYNQEVKLNFRFDKTLRDRIEQAASENERSMNAEIVFRLKQSFK